MDSSRLSDRGGVEDGYKWWEKFATTATSTTTSFTSIGVLFHCFAFIPLKFRPRNSPPLRNLISLQIDFVYGAKYFSARRCWRIRSRGGRKKTSNYAFGKRFLCVFEICLKHLSISKFPLGEEIYVAISHFR